MRKRFFLPSEASVFLRIPNFRSPSSDDELDYANGYADEDGGYEEIGSER